MILNIYKSAYGSYNAITNILCYINKIMSSTNVILTTEHDKNFL
jgi:hypothetical protein